MTATKELHDLGQSLWLDNITRDLLTSGTLQGYIDQLSVTGLTSNPSIFDHAIAHSDAYDAEIRRLAGRGMSGDALFFELAIEDLRQAADLFAPIHQRTSGVDGWVSLEVSPLLAHDAKQTVTEAKALHKKANRPNLFIKIPGTQEGAPAIEEAIYSGVPHQSFPAEATLDWQPSRLVMSIQPDEGIVLRSQAKYPGPEMHLRSVEMQFNYQDAFATRSPDAYETLLWDVMKNDATLFMRADQVEAAWRLLMPVLDVWAAAPPSDFPNYAAGTWGPEDAQGLLAQGHSWPLPSALVGCSEKKG